VRTSILFAAAVLGACATPRAVSPAPTAEAPLRALPFLEDQYPVALEQARAKSVPLFIELETSW
jgi:hypothetical protein